MEAEAELATSPEDPRQRSPIVLILAVLNLVFGTLGAVCCGGVAVMGLVPQLTQPALEAQQAEMDAEREQREQSFTQRTEEASTEEERAAVERERSRWREQNPDVDLASLFAIHNDPRLVRYYVAEAVATILSNLLLLISGIGLLVVARWGRTLALWVAGGKLVLIVAGTLYTILVVTPVAAELSEKMAAEMGGMVPLQGRQALRALSSFQAEMQRTFGLVGALGKALVASFYPMVLLVSLNLGVVKRSFPEASTSQDPRSPSTTP